MRPLHKGICKTCGVPKIWARDSVLDGDNTSLQRNVPMRGVFYEVDEIDNLVSSLEAALGVPLGHLAFQAHRTAISRFISGTLRGFAGSLATSAAPSLIYQQQMEVMPNFGIGQVSVAGYKHGGPLVVEATNAWSKNLLPADVAGSFGAVERCTAEVEIEEDGEVLRITATRGEQPHDEFRGRLVPLTGTLMGSPEYARCAACGAPLSFTDFQWDTARGVITERDNKLRVVHQTAACVESLMQEIEEELGDEVRSLAVRAQADFVKGRIDSGSYVSVEQPGGDTSRRLFDFLSLIRRRCMGNPIFIRQSGDELKVHIRNPASHELLAGRCLGTFEAESGVPCQMWSEHSEGMLKITVSPA